MTKQFSTKRLLLLICILTIASCKKQLPDEISVVSGINDTVKNVATENNKILNSVNRVAVDFTKNKDLLDIILLLPEKSFSSWDWKSEDRIQWYKEIKANNYYIDDDPNFFNLKYLKPNEAGFSIVDGFWSINIYKTSENTFVVVTNDRVGDGNTLNFYEVKSNTIKECLNENLLLPDHKEYLKKKVSDANCDEQFEELNDPIFVYNFSGPNKIEIESSWYLTEESYSDCFIGNAIQYNFNPQLKKFEVAKIYWKPKQNE